MKPPTIEEIRKRARDARAWAGRVDVFLDARKGDVDIEAARSAAEHCENEIMLVAVDLKLMEETRG